TLNIFLYYAAPPYLHSFPTRRSSDLMLHAKYPLKESKFYTFYQDINGGFKSRNALRQNHNTEADYAWVYFNYHLDKLPASQKLRSEEHTSELQSRENLVCRLLLEKKK